MKIEAANPEEYINKLPEDRKEPMALLRKTILENLPDGFEEIMSYGMIGYVIPLSLYPQGYHCTPDTPVPFINIASQKNHIAVYHMGLYANKSLFEWFSSEYSAITNKKLEAGKGCIRFKKPDQIPYKLIGELVTKITPLQWKAFYEEQMKKK